MKAIVYETCGSPDVLRCQEIEMPRVRDEHVLIKVRAASPPNARLRTTTVDYSPERPFTL